MDAAPADHDLRTAARLYGVQPSYIDVEGRTRHATVDALVAVLRQLGAPMQSAEDAAAVVAERRGELWRRLAPPVMVAWQGIPATVDLRLLATEANQAAVEFRVVEESGKTRSGTVPAAKVHTLRTRTVDGVEHVRKRFSLPGPLPAGYHRLHLSVAGRTAEVLVIAAPVRVYEDWTEDDEKHWGVFSPLYALHQERSWGGGDFTDLQALIDEVAGRGGSIVATLPLVSSFVQVTGDPSPYSPASRLFWNELYVDVRELPELDESPEAAALIADDDFQTAIEELQEQRLLDHGKLMGLKRRVLEKLAEAFFRRGQADPRWTDFERFLEQRPDVVGYARFRAANAERGMDWMAWPELSDDLAEYATDPRTRYHLYAQWVTDRQLEETVEHARKAGMTWYTDMPLGVSRDSFDVWSHPEHFALHCSGGSPPDSFFTKGQDWGFPPLHPLASRDDGHAYFIRTLRRQLTYANLLRIDHAMCLHRLWWVPHGLGARNGAYVRYPADELYAILSLESHRRRCGVVAENLGTVPDFINRGLAAHGIAGMYVVQYEARPGATPLRTPKDNEVASLNTHDMPPFAAYWDEHDIVDRVDLELLDDAEAVAEGRRRGEIRDALTRMLHAEGHLGDERPDTAAALRAVSSWLADSPARVVLVNIEDLYLETEPQNVPGTWKERPNWRRRLQFTLDGIRHHGTARTVLAAVAASRS